MRVNSPVEAIGSRRPCHCHHALGNRPDRCGSRRCGSLAGHARTRRASQGRAMRDSRIEAHLAPPITERRLASQWEKISARLKRGARASRSRLAMHGALAVAVIAVVFLVLGARRLPTTGPETFVLASLSDGRQELDFADGSRVTVAPGGRLRVDRVAATEVLMRLEVGRAFFDVKHNPSRRLAVLAAEYEIVDRGTRFEVICARDAGSSLEVRVEEGEVELRDPSHREPRRLTAGESWTHRPPAMAGTEQAAPEPAGGSEPPVTVPAVARASGEEAAPAAPPRSAPARAKRGDTAGAPDAQAARELFEQGNSAKLEGRLRDAADAFDMLRLRFRSDGHAALAALEL